MGAVELLKCLEKAGVAQAQVWFSLDPVKVFPGWLYLREKREREELKVGIILFPT